MWPTDVLPRPLPEGVPAFNTAKPLPGVDWERATMRKFVELNELVDLHDPSVQQVLASHDITHWRAWRWNGGHGRSMTGESVEPRSLPESLPPLPPGPPPSMRVGQHVGQSSAQSSAQPDVIASGQQFVARHFAQSSAQPDVINSDQQLVAQHVAQSSAQPDVIASDQQLVAQSSAQSSAQPNVNTTDRQNLQLVALPRELVTAENITMIREWGVDYTVVSQVADKVLRVMYPAGGHVTELVRDHANKTKQDLQSLWSMGSVAERYGSTFRFFSNLQHSFHNEESFDHLFKEQSKKGYDVMKGRPLDYGNWAYKAFLLFASLRNPDVYETSLQLISEVVPSCGPAYEDTETSLGKMGDLVECMYGVARGTDFHDLRNLYDADEWWKLYLDSGHVFHSLNYLQCKLHGGLLKRTMEWKHRDSKFQIPPQLKNTTQSLAAVAFLIVQRGECMCQRKCRK